MRARLRGFSTLGGRSSPLSVLHDPVEHPSARVLPTDALSLCEQALPLPRRDRGILGEKGIAAHKHCGRWCGRLNTVARHDRWSLLAKLHSPPHSSLLAVPFQRRAAISSPGCRPASSTCDPLLNAVAES